MSEKKTSLFTKIRRIVVTVLFLAVIANGFLLYRIYKVHGADGILHPDAISQAAPVAVKPPPSPSPKPTPEPEPVVVPEIKPEPKAEPAPNPAVEDVPPVGTETPSAPEDI